MNLGLKIVLLLLGLLLIPWQTYAQEEKEFEIEESAEVFLEEYSDQFQESFFEALKQKGIENYDKAIHLFLECKRLDADNVVVDHELAKAYLADKQYVPAQEYAIEALISEPANLWYLDTLVEIVQKQGSSMDAIKSSIPFNNNTLKENLALIYFKQRNYESALDVLKEIKKTTFSEDLSSKIQDSIKNQEENSDKTVFSASNTRASDPLEQYKTRIRGLIGADSLPLLQQLSSEALESYPSQPYFYYAQGHVLNKMAKREEAVEVLEAGLDYVLEDVSLSNKIYQELVDAYTALNNTSKANMYLRMIKPGF